jgi:hypothetical protein
MNKIAQNMQIGTSKDQTELVQSNSHQNSSINSQKNQDQTASITCQSYQISAHLGQGKQVNEIHKVNTSSSKLIHGIKTSINFNQS